MNIRIRMNITYNTQIKNKYFYSPKHGPVFKWIISEQVNNEKPYPVSYTVPTSCQFYKTHMHFKVTQREDKERRSVSKASQGC